MKFCAIGLDNPKSNVNVGSALRAADVYGASFVATTGRRYKGSPTDVSTAHRKLPLFRIDNLKKAIPLDCVPVAVDLIEGSQSLVDYEHPDRAFYIFGAEDATLGKRITDFCRDVVHVPTNGCMNLAATVNVVLYDRLAKEK